MEIARSTMCAWMLAMAVLVRPLYELMAVRVRRSAVIHTDDTRVPVQAEGKCKSGRTWVYLGDESNPYDIYEYTPDRSRDGPVKWLAGYQGYLQADAYGAYDGIYHNGKVIEVACWAHCRRKWRPDCKNALLIPAYSTARRARASLTTHTPASSARPDHAAVGSGTVAGASLA
ncbi:MAG: transposase [Tepidisphaerales bacterium]